MVIYMSKGALFWKRCRNGQTRKLRLVKEGLKRPTDGCKYWLSLVKRRKMKFRPTILVKMTMIGMSIVKFKKMMEDLKKKRKIKLI